jgi:Domain of unknown function (DUF4115)
MGTAGQSQTRTRERRGSVPANHPTTRRVGRQRARGRPAAVRPVEDQPFAIEHGYEAQPVLKPAQERVLASLAGEGVSEFTRADYERIAHVSRSQAAYDLADLVKAGIVQRLGSGRATRYRVERAAAGRRRKWTPDRIRAELAEFSAELGRWPRAAEFKEADRVDLYVAASRYGGIDHWMSELGFSEPPQALPAQPPSTPRARKPRARKPWAFGLAAAVTAAALAALAVYVLRAPSGDLSTPGVVALPAGTPDGAVAQGAEAVAAKPPARTTAVDLRLTAATAACWIQARRGSATGAVIYEGVLDRGDSRRFRGKRLWLRLGAPAGLRALLNGKRVALPDTTSSVLVTRKGIQVLKTAAPPSRTLLVRSATADDGDSGATSSWNTTSTTSSATSPARAVPAPDPAPAPSPSPDPAPDGG